MAPPVARKTFSVPVTIAAIAGALVLVAALFFLHHPASSSAENPAATAEAKAYLAHLNLSDVNMQATENFMHQQVVEIQGNITNNGPRKLASVSVYCLFSGLNGAEVHRERLAIVRSGSAAAPMASGENPRLPAPV